MVSDEQPNRQLIQLYDKQEHSRLFRLHSLILTNIMHTYTLSRLYEQYRQYNIVNIIWCELSAVLV